MFYIYRITNNVNGKTYIGQRKCPKNKTPMEDTYMGSGKLIKQAIKKHGIENFTKTIICRFFTREMTNFAELYYIKKEMQRGKDCYNILVGAHWNKGHLTWNKGKKMSEEQKAKISASEKGRLAWNKGKTHSEESKAKISAALKGRTAWNKGKKGQPAWNKGKKMSEEQKVKLSAAHKGLCKGKHWKLVDGKRVWY